MKQENATDLFYTTSTNEPVTITDSAIKQLKKILEESTVPENYFLRIGVKGGGCSGLSYVLDFDEKKQYDKVFEFKELSFIVDRRHLMYLEGTLLDFSEGLDNRGFTFDNPNAESTCGCGNSFST